MLNASIITAQVRKISSKILKGGFSTHTRGQLMEKSATLTSSNTLELRNQMIELMEAPFLTTSQRKNLVEVVSSQKMFDPSKARVLLSQITSTSLQPQRMH